MSRPTAPNSNHSRMGEALGRMQAKSSDPAWLGGALTLAAVGATMGAYLLARRGAVHEAGLRPGPRTALDRLRLPASPAVLGSTPHRHLRAGGDLSRAVTIEDLRAMAHRRLPSFALEYLEGGGEEEATLARNLEAFADLYFVHDMLVDVSRRDISTTLFGRRMAMPVVIAPTGLNGVFWPHAEYALAEAAGEAGIPYAQSTMSNDSMEEVARHAPETRRWWQLYVFGPPHVRETLIARAREAGCEALVVTVGAQVYGNREWDHRNRVRPETLTWSSELDALVHPRWLASTILSHGMPRFENVLEFVPENRRGFFDSAFWIRAHMDQALSWETMGRIRDLWPRKLIVKGLLSPGDVVRAAELGADAVVLSNHGGRQLDWAVSALDVLPEARAAVGDRITILVDGGVRRGTDIIKALALGADAVLVGRATLYGLAAGGGAGVARALKILKDEIDRDLGLLGVNSIDALGPHLLARRRVGAMTQYSPPPLVRPANSGAKSD